MLNVAKLAGVSLSTVSRVINDQPRVAISTVETVRRAMAELNFTPPARRGATSFRRNGRSNTVRLAFVVLSPGAGMSPGFERLLRGLSDASANNDVEIGFHFLQHSNRLPARVAHGQVDGVLLFGPKPIPVVQKQLESMPTVWLMANPDRPTWGDQVMPDNTRIGELAARYLVDRGHQHLAFLNAVPHSWGLEVRGLFFGMTARELGAQVTELRAADLNQPQLDWRTSVDLLVQRLQAMENKPTGLFVLEDCILPVLQTTLAKYGMEYGPGSGLDLISCNNERQYFIGLRHVPATIDIQTESIARRGVEQMLWRLSHPDSQDRVRFTVEPVLVDAEN